MRRNFNEIICFRNLRISFLEFILLSFGKEPEDNFSHTIQLSIFGIEYFVSIYQFFVFHASFIIINTQNRLEKKLNCQIFRKFLYFTSAMFVSIFLFVVPFMYNSSSEAFPSYFWFFTQISSPSGFTIVGPGSISCPISFNSPLMVAFKKVPNTTLYCSLL